MRLGQAQKLFLAHLGGQVFPFPTAVLSLPTESSLPALTLQQKKAPLALWFCISLALWSALLCFRVLLLSRVQLLIYQSGTTHERLPDSPGWKSISQTTSPHSLVLLLG